MSGAKDGIGGQRRRRRAPAVPVTPYARPAGTMFLRLGDGGKRTKRPTGAAMLGWTRPDFVSPAIGPEDNVGLRMDSLTGIDCDGPGAADWWADNGPHTPYVSESRTGRRVYWYRGEVMTPGFYRWATVPGGADMGEVRVGHKCQTVIPPSIHPETGRTYRWVGEGGEPDWSDLSAMPELPQDRMPPTAAGAKKAQAARVSADGRKRRALSGAPDVVEWVKSGMCPAGDHNSESLSLGQLEDGRYAVKCHNAVPCATIDIIDALVESGEFNRDQLWPPAHGETDWDAPPAPRPGTRFRASDLAKMTLDPVKWAVPDLVPEGLTLLAGPPKLGKSWLVLDVAISVAAGREVLRRAVDQRDVLYLALEDNPRRLQQRMNTLLAGEPAPERLELWTQAATLSTGVVAEIEDWLDMQPKPGLVIIDTLGRVQEGSAWLDAKDGGYADAVSALASLQSVAAERGVGIVVVTHTKKGGWAQGADPLEAVLGSQGYAGTADAVLVMKRERGEPNGELFVTGREVEEELTEAIWFDRDTCRWNVGDETYAEEQDGLSGLEAQLLDFLELRDGKKGEYVNAWQRTAESIALVVHRRRVGVEDALAKLEAAGLVTSKPRPGRGRPGKLWGPAVGLPPGLEVSEMSD